MLVVNKLAASYGPAQVLFDVTFAVGAGEVVTLLGRNGMGKTTTIRTLMGLVRARDGAATFDGRELIGLAPFVIAQTGLGLVPEGREVFPTLTVEENLVATAAARFGAPQWTLPRVYALFPRLAERRANLGNQLSGGEQQMLAVGRALVLNPKIVLLDEPLEGLAPIIVEELLAALTRLIRDEGTSAILVEQSPQKILGVTDRAVILERGAVVYQSTSAALAADRSVLETYLGVTDQGPRRGQQ